MDMTTNDPETEISRELKRGICIQTARRLSGIKQIGGILVGGNKLKAILEKHEKWLNGEKDGEKADLSDADLREADLSWGDLSEADLNGSDLSCSNLSWVKLRGADLRCSNLRGAKLSDANLRGVKLRGSDLRGADLSDANLNDANLRGVKLRGANLRGANLSEANLRGADLSWADLSDANLNDANLRGADLSWANLRGAKLPPPGIILLASWSNISDDLCKRCMQYDAHNVEKEQRKKFSEWVKGGSCPMRNSRYQRSINFNEKKELWDDKLLETEPWTAFRIVEALINEKCKQED